MFNTIKNKIRMKLVEHYAKGLVLAMRSAVSVVATKNPSLDLNRCIEIALLDRRGWKSVINKNPNYEKFVFKNEEYILINEKDSFADVLCKIADVEVRDMYFKLIDRVDIKTGGKLMLRGLNESEIIERIIREESKRIYERKNYKISLNVAHMHPTYKEIIQINPRMARPEEEYEKLLNALTEKGFVWDDENKFFYNEKIGMHIRTQGLDLFDPEMLERAFQVWSNPHAGRG